MGNRRFEGGKKEEEERLSKGERKLIQHNNKKNQKVRERFERMNKRKNYGKVNRKPIETRINKN